jgi:hypothetical protein
MAQWILKDSRGALLGPLDQETAVALTRQRRGVFVAASSDGGKSFRALKLVTGEHVIPPEIASAAKAAQESAEAQRVWLELDRYKELKAWQLFSVPETATTREFREGFLSLAKRYHPGRLDRAASSALTNAHMAMYQYLLETIHQVEQRDESVSSDSGFQIQHSSASGIRSTPSSVSQIRAPFVSSSSSIHSQPFWSMSVLNLEKQDTQMSGRLTVTKDSAIVFTTHKMMNLQNHAAFFPIVPPLKMGTRLAMKFHFEEAHKDIEARCAVAFENVNNSSRDLKGFGVKIDGIKPEELGFMRRESARLLGTR